MKWNELNLIELSWTDLALLREKERQAFTVNTFTATHNKLYSAASVKNKTRYSGSAQNGIL